MKEPLFILGFLLHHGPLETGNLEQLLEGGTPDLPAFRFNGLETHLDQLERKGQITVTRLPGKGPDTRRRYAITEEGRQAFIKLLEKALAKDYEAEFLLDAVFFFGDSIPVDQLVSRLINKKKFLETALSEFRANEARLMERFIGGREVMARVVFRHHESHYEAEISWLRETIMALQNARERRQHER